MSISWSVADSAMTGPQIAANGSDTQRQAEPAHSLEDVPSFEADDRPLLRTKPRHTNTLTWVLLGCLVALAGFYGGVRVQKAKATTVVSAGAGAGGGAASATGGAAGGFSGRGNAAGNAAVTAASTPVVAGGPTVGMVKLVDGDKVYIQDAAGNIIKVTSSPETAVAVAQPATVAQVRAGDAVEVSGVVGADGFITATAIRSFPSATAPAGATPTTVPR